MLAVIISKFVYDFSCGIVYNEDNDINFCNMPMAVSCIYKMKDKVRP